MVHHRGRGAHIEGKVSTEQTVIGRLLGWAETNLAAGSQKPKTRFWKFTEKKLLYQLIW